MPIQNPIHVWSYGTPAYTAFWGGTGDRSKSVIVTVTINMHYGFNCGMFSFVDGVFAGPDWYFNADTVSGKYIQFDFYMPMLVTEAKWYQSTANNEGTWQWQGSNNAVNWTDIGATFVLGGATTQTITTLSGNTTGYRYYRLFGISGNVDNVPYTYEMEFKIAAGALL